MRPLGFLLVALLVLPLAAAQEGDTTRDAVLLVYHPHPDPRASTPEADPFSSPRATGTPALLAPGHLPATLVDGVERADPSPEGRPESALSHFREVQRLVQQRERTGAGASLVLDVEPGARDWLVHAIVEPRAPQHGRNLTLSFVLFEDGAPYESADGRQMARFVARADVPGTTFTADGSAFEHDQRVSVEPAWTQGRVGVVALVRDASGEVLQAASWTSGQQAPTRQVEKAVLVEHATATWCDSCAPADEAMTLLATRGGSASIESAGSYLRAPGAWTLAGASTGAALGVLFLRRRRGL